MEAASAPDAERRPALRPAVPADDQHGSQQPLAARRLRVDAVRHRGGSSSAAAPGLFFDRVPLRALANAILSAGNTSDVANLRQTTIQPVAAQAGAPVFPAILAAPVPSVTLPNLTTMNPAMQNAYSRQANVEVEQQLGEREHRQRGLRSTLQRPQPDHLGQPERARRARPRAPTTAAARIPTYANNSQYSPRRARNTTACTCRSCSGRRSGASTASATRCRRRCRTSASSSSARRSIPSISTRTGAAPTTISATGSS